MLRLRGTHTLSFMLLKAWLGPFILTFVIAQFVLVMQFLWKHIDDLAGKGLEWSIILELLYYASATLVPMALPLAILLSSIMTVGSLAENLEVVAAKAAGIPLLRLLRPLMLMAGFIAILAFLFSNHVMPVANYKFRSLLSAIRSAKPAIDITPGVFYNGIRGLTVYIDQKAPDGKSFFGVMIYDHSRDGWGASVLTMAEKGSLGTSTDERYLVLRLENGVRYDDRGFYENLNGDFKRMKETFFIQELFIDVSDEKLNKENSFLKSSYQMMSLGQLEEMMSRHKEDQQQFIQSMSPRLSGMHGTLSAQEPVFSPMPQALEEGAAPQEILPSLPVWASTDSLFKPLKPDQRNVWVAGALSKLGQTRQRFQELKDYQKSQGKTMASALVEWHRKFTLSFACLVLFFIGAPLGAIIRKGGLGLPLIFCVLIFIGYHILSTIGERSAKQILMEPWIGMWLSSMILLPFGLLLTLRVSTESRWFALETYQMGWNRWFRKKNPTS
jgi:lipopolysaccharide export system permease protein